MDAISNTIDKVQKALLEDFRIIENGFRENVIVLNAKKKNIINTIIWQTAVKMMTL